MFHLPRLSRRCLSNITRRFSSLVTPDLDTDYYCETKHVDEIRNNINSRKGTGDIDKVIQLYNKVKLLTDSDETYESLKVELINELAMLPNKTHPQVSNTEDPHLVRFINEKPDFKGLKPLEFSEITRRLNLLRTDSLGNTCGSKSYYFLGELAELEEALIKYTVSFLLKEGFQLVSVPDILPTPVVESCGMNIKSNRTQIYFLDPVHHGPDLCLSGTSEMSLAGLLMNSTHQVHALPLKLAAVSRCYRAETSNVAEERGIYRVHQFTKVEMFAVSTPDQSDSMLEYIREKQEELFAPLGIHLRVLDMPPHELGAPAFRKYDLEAWMPGRNNYGEVSSCSNCTDYQTRRLHIKYLDKSGNAQYAHTLNGTACAVPRMLITLLETHQHPKGRIMIPECLKPFMNGKEFITKNNNVPELKLLKSKK